MSVLERLVLRSPIQRTSRRVKWTSGARDMISSLLECFSVVFLDLTRDRETIKLLAVKTVFLCTVFTVQLGPKPLKLCCCVLYSELGWGQPRQVLTAGLWSKSAFLKLTKIINKVRCRQPQRAVWAKVRGWQHSNQVNSFCKTKHRTYFNRGYTHCMSAPHPAYGKDLVVCWDNL